MTPAAFLADLLRCGASVIVVADRLRVEAAPGVLTPAVREVLAAQKANLLPLVAFAEEYRALLGDDTADTRTFRDEQARLIDELGPTLATTIHHSLEREYATGSGPNRNPPTVKVNGCKNRATRE